MNQNPTCKFCKQEKNLSNSHYVPRFVVKQLGNQFRLTDRPNLKVQDAFKYPLLCADCEKYFNTEWEQPFQHHFFNPYYNNEPIKRYKYGSWMLKFVTSLTWRIAIYHSEVISKDNSSRLDEKVQNAVNVWESFLKDETEHPSSFEQHLFPLDILLTNVDDISDLTKDLMWGIVGCGIYDFGKETYVQAKLGKLCFIGIVESDGWANQRKTRLSVKEGYIEPSTYSIDSLPRHIINGLTRSLEEGLSISENLSEKQIKEGNSKQKDT